MTSFSQLLIKSFLKIWKFQKLFLPLHQEIVLANRKATLTVVFLCRLSGAVFLFVLLGNILVHDGIVRDETPMTVGLFPSVSEFGDACVRTDIEARMQLTNLRTDVLVERFFDDGSSGSLPVDVLNQMFVV